MNPNLRDIKAIGSDGDEALQNAIEICFQDAIKLLCVNHKRENIEKQLRKSRGNSLAVNHIMADIFGKEKHWTYEKGLIDSQTASEFDQNLKDFKATWDSLIPSFHTWFVQYEAELFKRHLITEVTCLANLEGPFNNNRTESINNNLKNWIGRAGKVSFSALNGKVKELVLTQQQEFELSIFGNGPYQLSKNFESMRKERQVWNAMTAAQRKDALQEFWSSSRLSEHRLTLATINSPSLGPSMSVDVNSLEWLYECVSKECLEEVWTKAEKLLLKPNAIVEAPGFDGIFVRHSADDTGLKPNLVTNQNGKFQCECNLFKASSICEHVVAVAEQTGQLEAFLQKRKKNKSQTNITTMVMSGIKSGAKPKVAKPRKGGRTPLDKPKPTSSVSRMPVVEDASTLDAINALDEMDTEQPFEIIYLFQTKASACYGCGTKYIKENENNTLIIRKFCEREYFVAGEKKSRLQFAYFHLKSSCVRKKFPDFKKEILTIANESVALIPAKVKEKLISMGMTV